MLRRKYLALHGRNNSYNPVANTTPSSSYLQERKRKCNVYKNLTIPQSSSITTNKKKNIFLCEKTVNTVPNQITSMDSSEYIERLYQGNICEIQYVWEQIQKLFDNDGQENDRYGWDSDMNDNFVVISAIQYDVSSISNAGAVFVYKRQGDTLSFSQLLLPETPNNNGNYGSSIVLNDNYNQLFIGEIGDNSGGSVSIYELSGNNLQEYEWIFTEKIYDPDISAVSFGRSIATYNNYLFIGDERNSTLAPSAGSVCIYDNIGGNWNFIQRLTDPSGGTNDNFGWSVDVYDDYAVVGSRFYDPSHTNPVNHGAVLIYKFVSGTWSYIQRIEDDIKNDQERLGWNVRIYKDRLFVSNLFDVISINEHLGSVLYYQLNMVSGIWEFRQKITAMSGFESNISYGIEVDVNDTYLFIGSHRTGNGYVDIYKIDTNNTTYSFFQRVFDITDDTIDEDNFGYSISLFGDYAVITSRFDAFNSIIQQGSSTYYKLNARNIITS